MERVETRVKYNTKEHELREIGAKGSVEFRGYERVTLSFGIHLVQIPDLHGHEP